MGRVHVEPLDATALPPHGVNVCYVIGCGDRTYNGSTVDLAHRLRQHNGDIKGGAKATAGRGPWEVLAFVTSPSPAFDWPRALSLEWHIRHPFGRRRARPRAPKGRGAETRVSLLAGVLASAKFAALDFVVRVRADLLGALGQGVALGAGGSRGA